MLPSITPPTDSLYKFLTLFGLTIFLFYVIMLSDTYHNSTLIEIKIENLAFKMQEETGVKFKFNHDHKISLRPFQRLEDQLNLLETTLANEKIEDAKKYQFKSQMNAYQIQIDANQTKIAFCWGLIFAGILVIAFGFILWHNREQKLRNILLQLEIEEKQANIRNLNKNQTV